MEYKLGISTKIKKNVFYFEKTQYARTFDEIIDYVNEMAKIFKKSTKVFIAISDGSKLIAQYNYDYGWLVF